MIKLEANVELYNGSKKKIIKVELTEERLRELIEAEVFCSHDCVSCAALDLKIVAGAEL